MSENNGNNGRILDFNDIEAFDDSVHIQVSAFGGIINLSSLGAEQMAEYLEFRNEPSTEGMRNTICLVYSMLSPSDWEMDRNERKKLVLDRTRMLRKKNLDTLVTLTRKALEINGLTPEQVVERKNASGEVPSGASPTA